MQGKYNFYLEGTTEKTFNLEVGNENNFED